jgi:hypothetical protein
VNGGDLLVVLLPIVAIFGTAFFYLLLDRIPFRIKLTRGAAIGAFVILNISPMIFSMLPPRRGPYPYPPYISPVTRSVAAYFEPDALACSDLPWAMAWDGEHRTVWLPTSLDDFYEINDFVAPKGFQYMMLTPYLIDQKPQSEVANGEYKGWATFLHGQIPQNFPLKAYSMLPPSNEQVLLADRVRWASKKIEGPETEGAPAAQPGATNAPPGSTQPTNPPAAPAGATSEHGSQ